MPKSFVKIGALAIAAVAVLSASACGKEGKPKLYGYTSFAYFNTTAQWAYYSETAEKTERENAVWGKITDNFKAVEDSISADVTTSDISRFNAAAAGSEVEIGATAFNILSQAKAMYEKTGGAYNPAVGLLVDLWGFTPRFTDIFPDLSQAMPYDRENYEEELPDEKYITAFCGLADFSAVEISSRDGKYYVQKPESACAEIDGVTYTMQLNLGGIGKGYAVDEAEKIVREAGYTQGYINLGGSSMCAFTRLADGKEQPWPIGVINPRRTAESAAEYVTVVESNVSLSSSGDYENCYVLDGVRYCHIIDSATGYPVNAAPQTDGSGIIGASVFGLSAAEGDATSTALMVMGKERALSYIRENLSDKDVVFLYFDSSENAYTVYTNMADGKITLNESSMRMEKI